MGEHSLHVFDRADRFLPHGWCLLPPPQTCSKGNACLTCSVFVTDTTHQPVLERQLGDTEQLIARTTAEFQRRHDQPIPEDNVWLAQRRAEHAALTQLLAAMTDNPRPRHARSQLPRHSDRPGPLTLGTTRTHRQEVQALRAALEQAHGENLNLRRELARRGITP